MPLHIDKDIDETFEVDAFVLQEPERESNEGSYCFQVLKFLRLSGRTTTFDNT